MPLIDQAVFMVQPYFQAHRHMQAESGSYFLNLYHFTLPERLKTIV